jgi:hypothetical protein
MAGDNVVRLHPTWFKRYQHDTNPHLSPIERLIIMLKADDPSLCDHDCMAIIAHTHLEMGWGTTQDLKVVSIGG